MCFWSFLLAYRAKYKYIVIPGVQLDSNVLFQSGDAFIVAARQGSRPGSADSTGTRGPVTTCCRAAAVRPSTTVTSELLSFSKCGFDSKRGALMSHPLKFLPQQAVVQLKLEEGTWAGES